MSRCRFDGDFTAHQLDQPLADRQAEPGAAEAAGDAGIALEEGVEQPGDNLGGHADARIADGKGQPAACCIPLQGLDSQRDATLGGKFDGVTDQVDQDLLEAAMVAQQSFGQFVTGGECQRQAFLLGSVAKQRENVVDLGLQREGLWRQRQFAGLDLGEVENVIDQAQQAVGAAAHGAGEIALFFVELRGQQQIAHADDAVHRRADFMAHVGEEAALGGVRVLCGPACGFQRLHRHLAFKDSADPAGEQADELDVGRIEVVVAAAA